MAIGPIGSAIFTNQMTPVASSVQNAYNNRIDFQNMIAQSVVQERDEKVLEVRPAEENKEINEDKEHTRDEADRENQRSEQKDKEEEEDSTSSGIYKLDIRV